jgi:hypothetical protein
MNKDLNIETKAIMEFVNTMIGAYEADFVLKNNPTLSEIYQVARNHCRDTYGSSVPDIVQAWGEDTARICGFKESNNNE